MKTNDIYLQTISKILNECLNLKPKEKCLFFTDSNSRWEDNIEEMIRYRKLLHKFYEAFFEFKNDFPLLLHDKFESTGLHGAEPRENIWKIAFGEKIYNSLLAIDYFWKLKEEVEFDKNEWERINSILITNKHEVVDCVIAFPWYSTTHTRFRRLLNQLGCRYISMPQLTDTVIEGPLKANAIEVAEKTDMVYNLLLKSHTIHMTCPAGSDIIIEIGTPDQIHKDTGLFHIKGAFGNLPAGEAYIVPKDKSAKGLLAFTSGPGRSNFQPTIGIVREGEIVGFQNDTEYSKILSDKFQQDFNMRHIAEFGIGTNPKARDYSSMIEGEKIYGTVHVAIGDDSSIGGDTEATEHWDHIILNPTVKLRLENGKNFLIIENGEPLRY